MKKTNGLRYNNYYIFKENNDYFYSEDIDTLESFKKSNEFLNIELLWLLVLIPISILWYLYANHYKSNSLNFSNSAAFSESKS